MPDYKETTDTHRGSKSELPPRNPDDLRKAPAALQELTPEGPRKPAPFWKPANPAATIRPESENRGASLKLPLWCDPGSS
jgi:hypothetical protein